jgi:hypothetical protein
MVFFFAKTFTMVFHLSYKQILIYQNAYLPLSHSHLLNSLTSSPPQLIVPPISYLNHMLGFFLVSLWSL